MSELVFFLEEESAKAFLQSLLPRMLDHRIETRVIAFEGKQDLEKQLPKRLKGYLNQNARFLVLRDQDSAPDCKEVKKKLISMCTDAGKREHCVVRIACRELETIYLGDLAAVEKALEIHSIAQLQRTSKFRTPDRLESPSTELERVSKGRYQKVSGSRKIGKFLDIDNETSATFKNLIQGIKRLEAQLLAQLPAAAQ